MIIAIIDMDELPEDCMGCVCLQVRREVRDFFDNPYWCPIYRNAVSNPNKRPAWCSLIEADEISKGEDDEAEA